MSTRDQVARLHAGGLTGRAIAGALGVSPPTVSYHLRRLGVPASRAACRYRWEDVQTYYDEGHSVRECSTHFGFSTQSWHEAVKRRVVTARPQAMPVAEPLVGTRNRTHVKRRLIRLGLLDPRCDACGLTDWRGAPLALELHHVNGDGKDNRLANLQLLCPNCHSQTDSWGGRNRGVRALRAA